jgi:protein-L-isoaspartate O-methyltransferase
VDDVTLATYEARAQTYRDLGGVQRPALRSFLDRVAAVVGDGSILELGTGPGFDAALLEARGCRVTRTDGAYSFVEMLQSAGHEARRLDVRTDAFGDGFDAVLAQAVLLHLTRDEYSHALVRARDAVVQNGLLAVTLKEGDGSAWSEAKLDLPRYFTFWRAAEVSEALAGAGWSVIWIDHVMGATEPWLYVLAHAV